MTGMPGDDELNEQIEIAAGRKAPFSQLGDWVALAAIPGESKALYWYFQMHVNQTRGDGLVWPAREVLAALGGFSRPQTIDKYIKPLVKIGAVDVKRVRYANGLRARNVYTIHQTPPAGYAGFTSLEEFYRARKEAAAAAEAAAETAGQTDGRERAHRGDVDKGAGQPGSARTRTSGGAQERTPVVRESAQELDEVKPHEGETKDKTPPASQAAESDALFDVEEVPPPPPKDETLPQKAERVTKTWWDGRLAIEAELPTQSFIAVKGVITTALKNNYPEDEVVGALNLLMDKGKPISGGTLRVEMTELRKRQGGARRRAGDVNSAWKDGTAQQGWDEFFTPKAANQ